MPSRRNRPANQAPPSTERLLQPQPDLPKAERDVARSAIELVEELSTRYEPDEAARFIRTLHDELVDLWAELERRNEKSSGTGRDRSRAKRSDLTSIVGEPLSRDERIAILERGLTRRFERRRQLRSESLQVSQVAELLGLSRQTLYDRRRAGRMLAIRLDNTLLFPAWQFDPEQPDGVLQDFPRVVEALQHLPPLARYAWFTSPKPAFDNRTAVDLLKERQGDDVVRVARAACVA